MASSAFFRNPAIFLDLADFVTSLHATFGRKLARIRESVKDAFFYIENGKFSKWITPKEVKR